MRADDDAERLNEKSGYAALQTAEGEEKSDGWVEVLG